MSARKRAIAKQAAAPVPYRPLQEAPFSAVGPRPGPPLTFNLPINLDAASAQSLGIELLKLSGVHGTLII